MWKHSRFSSQQLTQSTKWHAHVVRIAKHMNMVGGPGPSLNPALYLVPATMTIVREADYRTVAQYAAVLNTQVRAS